MVGNDYASSSFFQRHGRPILLLLIPLYWKRSMLPITLRMKGRAKVTRKRKSYSCKNCKTSKTKCDRTWPCSQCCLRKRSSSCCFESHMSNGSSKNNNDIGEKKSSDIAQTPSHFLINSSGNVKDLIEERNTMRKTITNIDSFELHNLVEFSHHHSNLVREGDQDWNTLFEAAPSVHISQETVGSNWHPSSTQHGQAYLPSYSPILYHYASSDLSTSSDPYSFAGEYENHIGYFSTLH